MFYLIVGATNSGKDKTATYIMNDLGFTPIISTTSRPIRPSEVEGREYHFLTTDEFIKRVNNDEFIEHRAYNTIVGGNPEVWYYGVEKKHVSESDKDYVAVISYEGAQEFKKYYGEENVILVFVRATYEQRYIRNILRGDFDSEEWNRRNIEDEEWLRKAFNDADYIIDNGGWNNPANPTSNSSGIDMNESVRNSFNNTEKQIKQMISDVRENKNRKNNNILRIKN